MNASRKSTPFVQSLVCPKHIEGFQWPFYNWIELNWNRIANFKCLKPLLQKLADWLDNWLEVGESLDFDVALHWVDAIWQFGWTATSNEPKKARPSAGRGRGRAFAYSRRQRHPVLEYWELQKYLIMKSLRWYKSTAFHIIRGICDWSYF